MIVDLAADSGGNCELSRPGEVRVEDSVTIVTPLLLAASLPEHASQLYAHNVQAVLELMLDANAAPPVLRLDLSDEVLAAATADDPSPHLEEAVI